MDTKLREAQETNLLKKIFLFLFQKNYSFQSQAHVLALKWLLLSEFSIPKEDGIVSTQTICLSRLLIPIKDAWNLNVSPVLLVPIASYV